MAESLRFDIFAIDRASHVMDKIGDHSEKMGGKLGKAGRVAAVGLKAVAVGVGALAVGFGFGLKAADDYQKLTAQTGAVLKSTGEKAGVSAEYVQKLAESISGYSGQTREAVTRGENLLLTFTNIQNKTGKGNKIFDQATVALANMTQALGEDPKMAAIQLGKALNDPVKGMTALRRVGVSFSADQIKVVKHLVATGHTMAAQKLILKELNTEFGGSAKAAGATFGGSMERLKNSLTDVLVNALTPLLPALTKFAGVLANTIGPALQFAVDAVQLFVWSFTRNGDLEGLPDKFHDNVAIPIINAGVAVRGAIDKMRPTITALIGWVRGQLIPAFEKAGREILPALGKALKALGQELVKLRPTFQFLGTILTTLIIPVMAKVATTILQVMVPAFKLIGWAINTIALPVLKLMVRAWLDMVGVIIHGAADAFGWVPGIGGKLKKAAAQFDTFRDGVNNALNGVKTNITIQFHSQLDAALRKVIANPKLAQSLHGTFGVFASARGTNYAPGGVTLVGEEGPELVNLPRGAQVKTASQTAGMLGGGGGITVNINGPVFGDPKAFSREIHRMLIERKRDIGVAMGLA